MLDRLSIAAVHAAFLVYRAGVLVFGASAWLAQRRGLFVSFTPGAGVAAQFSGYPVPTGVVAGRPAKDQS